MKEATVRALLDAVRSGELEVESAIESLKSLPFEDLGYAAVDHHRDLRTGFPEVILAQGKTKEQVLGIAEKVIEKHSKLLITRLDAESAAFVQSRLEGLSYAPLPRVATFGEAQVKQLSMAPVAVVTAGTSDIAVAEEAACTLAMLGIPFERVYDVGVAGLHRLLAKFDSLKAASAVIVVAGMEGALPSVLGGLIWAPVVAVPASTGYGSAFGGVTSLLGMLNSCASGLSVVNIDNGFGAAMAIGRIFRSSSKAGAAHPGEPAP